MSTTSPAGFHQIHYGKEAAKCPQALGRAALRCPSPPWRAVQSWCSQHPRPLRGCHCCTSTQVKLGRISGITAAQASSDLWHCARSVLPRGVPLVPPGSPCREHSSVIKPTAVKYFFLFLGSPVNYLLFSMLSVFSHRDPGALFAGRVAIEMAVRRHKLPEQGLRLPCQALSADTAGPVLGRAGRALLCPAQDGQTHGCGAAREEVAQKSSCSW